MKIIKLKKWSQKNLSPLAWLRVILAIYPEIENFSLEELENPNAESQFSKQELKLVHDTIKKMYGVGILESTQRLSY
ncbi:MAG: hypothetical protein R8N23_12975 [Reichenbachiella sp.]|uniref:hypothetical protein n=1 Tax=Reichenbachiella sp. TaxID=2184521 RepID=UPI0029667FB3|nr:hypothetical protein [Reichenbachiella sp.]MDW3210781.1 hypothetical protein [Reichenbachiella sp.]